MPVIKKDPRVDAAIEKAADFARPILRHLRDLMHRADPEIEETLKWGMPAFMHGGIVAVMAAFKQHCTFGFWKHELIFGKNGSGPGKEADAMGQFGRITSLSDLPDDKAILSAARKAVELNKAGIKVPRRRAPARKKEVPTPDYLLAALKKNPKALRTFEAFSYSHKKEYVEWITEAKRPETRARRIATALQWLAQGKPRNWKYRC